MLKRAFFLSLPLGLALASSAPASAPQLKPCPDSEGTGWKCGYVESPLNNFKSSDKRKMMVYVRVLPGSGDHKQAMLFLAGGPGQTIASDSSYPWGPSIRSEVEPNLGGRDLVLFDPRGGGLSGVKSRSGAKPLSCKALNKQRDPGFFESTHSVTRMVASCLRQVGPTRAFYGTDQQVFDIEAIRRSLGYQSMDLYGVSYGTKMALQYARAFPASVDRMILDSSLDQPTLFDSETFKAFPQVLRNLCAQGVCAEATADPVVDFNAAVSSLQKKPLIGSIEGGSRGWRLTSSDLMYLMVDLDFAPSYRGQLVAALARYRQGDPAPLLRLASSLGYGRVPNPGTPPEKTNWSNGSEFNSVLYVTQACKDVSWPWRRSDSLRQREAKLKAAIRGAQPDLAPWSARSLYEWSVGTFCVAMPEAGSIKPLGPLPGQKTIFISGDQDTRTPTALAVDLSARMPQSRLQVVHNAGHSVLSSESFTCADQALNSFMRSVDPPGCFGDPAMSVRPLPQNKISDYSPDPALPGESGQALSALKANLVDAASMANMQMNFFNADRGSFMPIYGLNWGTARAEGSYVDTGAPTVNFVRGLALKRYSSTNGIYLSGTLDRDPRGRLTGSLRLTGAADGVIDLSSGSMSGTIGDTDFTSSSPDWPTFTAISARPAVPTRYPR